jgi:hypothetical protein
MNKVLASPGARMLRVREAFSGPVGRSRPV